MELVEKKILNLKQNFVTENGFALQSPQVAYEEYGNPDGPVIFITHGGLQDFHAAGKYSGTDPNPGPWDHIIGEHKAIDTLTYRVISANSLGSMFGTTSPLTLNPQTKKPYGADFPKITLIDMAKFYKLFLEEMGIKKLFLIAGPSMGSLQALQMASLFPDFVGGVISVATAGRLPAGGYAIHNIIINAIVSDPEFKNGRYEKGQVKNALRIIHQFGRVYYTHSELLKKSFWDGVPESNESYQIKEANIQNYLTAGLEEQVQENDPNCYVTLLKAINTYSLARGAESYEAGIQKIKCPVLLISLKTDAEFPPEYAHEVSDILNKKRPGQAKVIELDSMWGHIGCLKESAKIALHASDFIKEKLL